MISKVSSDDRQLMDRRGKFVFLLTDLSRRYVLRFEQRARDESLTLPQCKVLVHLENNGGVSQAKLAELADVDPMTMVRILDRMEADGLLERRPDAADRRARCLYLTRKAKPLLDKICRWAGQTRAETVAGIDAQEYEAFIGLLELMHSNVYALDDQRIEGAHVAETQTRPKSGKGARRARKPRTR
jgi:MarR family transcriptional regulator for hemolysin